MGAEQDGNPALDSAVGYEVYVRSFADTDGDGIGDIPGVIDRLDHLAWLGIDILWLTPFYGSPMADFGYDVSDYVDVNPLFGSLDDVDRLVEQAHGHGMRVIADLVPNHSSNEHPWFEAAVADPTGPYRDYYIWRDPPPDGGPPNNWLSHFGGPAWTLDEASGQYYCHLFLPEQPDLNWRNPAVHREFEEILRFWFERGIDGFRIDVAQALYKDEELRDDPVLVPLDSVTNAKDAFDSLDHQYDLLQPETLGVFRRWREIASDYGAILIGETYVKRAEQLADLVPGDGLHVGFWFATMTVPWDPAQITSVLRAPVEAVAGGVGWVLSSHDESRPVARFGGGDLGRRRSLGLSTLLFGLPGVPFLYQGEELGLDDARLAPEELTDPLEVRNDDTPGRDVCRTPMPWGPGPNFGFSTATETWLPVAHDEHDAAASQRAVPDSHLHRVKALIDARHALDISADVPVRWLDRTASVVGFWRGDVLFALNVSDTSTAIDLPGPCEVVFRSEPPAVDAAAVDSLALGADGAAIARRINA